MDACSTRIERLTFTTSPQWLDTLPARRGLWAENEGEKRCRLARAACEKRLLAWVRLKLDELSDVQRNAIELHYFGGLPLKHAGTLLHRNATTVMRAEKRAIRALRALYRADPSLAETVEGYKKGPKAFSARAQDPKIGRAA